MNFRLLICLMLAAVAMARKGSAPTNCRNTDCKGSVGAVQLGSSGTTGRGGSDCRKKNGEIRKKCQERRDKKNDNNFGGNLPQSSPVTSSPSVQTVASSQSVKSVASSPSVQTVASSQSVQSVASSQSVQSVSSSGNRDSRLINLGSLFGGLFGGNRPTSSFGGRPTSSIFGGRPTINKPISSFGSNHHHGSGFGNNHNHGFGQNHASSFGNSFGSSIGSSSFGCRFWCRTPQNQAYCCENSHQTSHGVAGFPKPGQCPPVRPFCPPTGRSLRPPSQCSSDARCPGRDKCCFDTCLQHHTCKPPQGGFFGR